MCKCAICLHFMSFSEKFWASKPLAGTATPLPSGESFILVIATKEMWVWLCVVAHVGAIDALSVFESDSSV